MTERYDTESEEVQEPVVVRDRRKVDPETGQLRKPQDESQDNGVAEAQEPSADAGGPAGQAAEAEGATGQAAATEGEDPVADLKKQLDERTADLQRLQAEYTNYRRRMEREREAMATTGKAAVLNDLLPLLDDLERAGAHGDLTGAFKAVSDKLLGVLEKTGLEPFGAEGDTFDPTVHEAVQHDTSAEVDGPTVTTVLRRGYRFDDRVLRAALVGVTDHEPAAAQPSADPDEPADPPDGGELPTDTDEKAH